MYSVDCCISCLHQCLLPLCSAPCPFFAAPRRTTARFEQPYRSDAANRSTDEATAIPTSSVAPNSSSGAARRRRCPKGGDAMTTLVVPPLLPRCAAAAQGRALTDTWLIVVSTPAADPSIAAIVVIVVDGVPPRAGQRRGDPGREGHLARAHDVEADLQRASSHSTSLATIPCAKCIHDGVRVYRRRPHPSLRR